MASTSDRLLLILIGVMVVVVLPPTRDFVILFVRRLSFAVLASVGALAVLLLVKRLRG